MVGTNTVLTLLLVEGLQDILHSLNPRIAENACIAGLFPILIGQTDHVAQRVDFPLALVQFGLHIGIVGHPVTLGVRLLVESVGIGIDVDALELAENHAGEHLLQFRILVGQFHIGEHLRAGVSQPHGVDVARIDEGVGITIGILRVVHGGIDGVGEAVDEHPCQSQVGELADNLLDLLLYGLRAEEAVGLGRTVVDAQDIGLHRGDLRGKDSPCRQRRSDGACEAQEEEQILHDARC